MPGKAYKEPLTKYRKLLNLKETEAFILSFHLDYNMKSLLIPSVSETIYSLLFFNLIFEENDNVVHITDLPEGQ